MKIFKSKVKIPQDGIVNENGDLVLTTESAFILDCILCVYASKIHIPNLHFLHLQLYQCGISITHPEMMDCLNFLIKDGKLQRSQLITTMNNDLPN